MIVTMHKVHVVARRQDRDALLKALRRLGVLHLVPVDPARAVPDAETTSALDQFRRARQILESTRPAGPTPDLAPEAAAAEVLRLQRESAELGARLSSLHRRIEQLALWGNLRLDQFADLQAAGLQPRFYAVPTKQIADLQAEFTHVLGSWPGRRLLVGVVHREDELKIPEGAEEIPLPQTDRPTLRAAAAEVAAALKAGAERLASLAHLAPALATAQARLEETATWATAQKSALTDDHLYALQGWVPETRVDSLVADLRAAGLETAVETRPAEPGEEPPTLIQCPRWASPIQGLFKVLGTVPGYSEFDVSAAFMIFLPIFSAIMISDLGYGLVYLLLAAVFYRKIAAAMGPQLGQLIFVVGGLSVVWGILTASFFGLDISGLMGLSHPWIQVDAQKINMDLLMRISFWLAAIHLSLAHLWLAIMAFPHPRFLGELGWATLLWGVFGIVKLLLLNDPFLGTVYPWLLIAGGVLAILFAAPSRNVAKMLGLGIAKFPLSAIGTLGDTISYVRLMALGVAGTALAVSFNTIAGGVPWAASIPILMAGHALNVALSVVSLLAHGVRLNVLEFSNNLGMQWSGYAYEPFATKRVEEN